MRINKDNGTLISILLVLIMMMGLIWVGLGREIYQNEMHLYKVQALTLELLEKQSGFYIELRGQLREVNIQCDEIFNYIYNH